MRLKVYTKADEPIEREALDLAKRVEEEGIKVEYYNLNEEESSLTKVIYDIYSTPAFVVASDDGRMVEMWQGKLPYESELFNYLRS